MKFIELTAPRISELAPHTVALLPVAATEQHGPHLAVSTDSAMAGYVAQQAEEALPDDVMLCPVLPFGSSHHHLGFGGTLSISHETYVRVLVDLVESLLQGGFRRIVILNGHGGNITPGRLALTCLSHRFDDGLMPNIAFATYWEVGGSAFAGDAPMETPSLSHACEYETSMMLHLHPERVHMEKARAAQRPPKNGYVPWEEDEPHRGISMSKRTHFISSIGSSGRPDLATAQKGAHLVEKASSSVIEFLKEFKDWPLMPDLREMDNKV